MSNFVPTDLNVLLLDGTNFLSFAHCLLQSIDGIHKSADPVSKFIRND
jgi:hypothetical protein